MFLRGSGFHPTGTLDFVQDDGYDTAKFQEMYDSMDLPKGPNAN